MSLTNVVTMHNKLSNDQKNDVIEMGFGGLLHLKSLKLKHDLVRFVIESVDPLSMKLRVHGKILEFTADDVELILGLPNRGEDVPLVGDDFCENGDSISELSVMYRADHRKLPLKDLWKELDGYNECDDHFRRLYVIFIVGYLLSPTTEHNNVRKDILYALRDLKKISSYNWAKFVYVELKESLIKCRGRKYVRGCVFVLVVSEIASIHFCFC
jgi:hypothetical protein